MAALSLSLLTIYYLCNCNAFKTIKPIVNATGEYYIATTTVPFKNETIVCNATINDCYIVCPFKESCENTKISCSSYHCSLNCGLQGCNYLDMTTNGTVMDITCGEKGCQFLKLNGYLSNSSLNSSFNLIATGNDGQSYINSNIQMYGYSNVDLQCTTFDGCSSSDMIFNMTNNVNNASSFHLYCYDGANPTQGCDTANITAIGYAHNNITCGNIARSAFGGCSRSIISVKPLKDLIIGCTDCQNTTFNIFEDDNYIDVDVDVLCCCNFGCINSQFMFTENNHFHLNMNCTSSFNSGCYGVTLYDISPYQDHNNLSCNGYTNKSIPCDNMTIYVPSMYEPKFISINYSNDTGNQFISMYCTSETCYNGIKFPIIDIVQQATISNESGVYFIGNTSYEYQYKSIICNSSVNCYVYCSEFASCSSSYIECNTTTAISSGCHVFATANLSFYGSVIKANDNNKLNVQCNTHKGYGCKNTLLQSMGGDISLICNGWTACNGSTIFAIDGNINILCGEYSCVGINVLETNNNATLNCYGDSSCQYANVGQEGIEYLHMNCSGYFGCYRANIYCTYSAINTCNVECTYNETVGGAACYYTTMNLPNTFDNGFLNVYKSCNEYNAPYQCGHMRFECNESEYGTSYVYKGSPINSNQCISKTCCPWKSEPPIFICNDNSNCSVDCNIINKTVNPYFAQIGCSNGIIDGENANELIVNCSINNNCIDTTIKCPVTRNGSICSIYCNGISSCLATVIQANYTDNLYIFCGSQQSGCKKMKIYAENVRNFTLKSMNTTNGQETISYLDIFVMNAENVDIDCKNGRCSYLNLFAQNASHVNIYCEYGNIGSNACFNNIFNLENVKIDINLWFNGVRSCNNCTIYAQFAELLNISLLSNETDNFQNVTIWAPQKINGTYLDCINYGCFSLNWYLENGLNDINVNYSGNCNKWINKWNIQCLIDLTNITFDGNDCSDYQSKCCNKNETEIISGVYTKLCPPSNNKKNKLKGWQIGVICGVGIGIILVAVIILIKKKCDKPNDQYIGGGLSTDPLVGKK